MIDQLPRDLPGERVLDLGCGRGSDAEPLTSLGAEVVAMEYDPRLFEVTQPGRAARILGDGRATSSRDAAFHGVHCSNVLEHSPDPAGIVAEAARITEPGGWIWLSWTNWGSPVGGHGNMPFHYLGRKVKPKLYARLFGEPTINVVGRKLWPVHIGQILKLIRRDPPLELVSAVLRYYPSQRWILRVPGLREVLTWNCAITIRRRPKPPR